MNETALKAGYKRLCRFGPQSFGNPDYLADIELKDYPLFNEYGGLEDLIKHVRNGEPVAVVCHYDYGAHIGLVRQ